MNFLVLDTSTEACSVALMKHDEVFSQFELCPQQHSQRILPMVEEILIQSQCTLGELDFIGFGRGPGSFTGVRIATGIVQGLALGANLPVVGVSTLAAMAAQSAAQHADTRIACSHDARMQELYFGLYEVTANQLIPLAEECVAAPDEVATLLAGHDNVTLVGTGWPAYPDIAANALRRDILYPDARYMLELARQAWSNGEAVSAENIEPVYLRDKVTWKKLPGRE
ncbi:tRNA (adenosine(37)-N6)-threonylcarbamoyltransferase complex dimerization subunit type 1 TsaB [Bowmanella sp. JS7-9]|uniref:tRNA threonylcarbamoyladenosine biosynthesis protein TsaB n=1 Tax=Pseudobowmanella zhangzhouensis TaxID=1537679 RepID=A0ABW1XJR2_9ALTE|nr:tRNA (adenosine(37)-N6)-threonylcarbamoyltransferase complex dimerization subunit type 1 TsaB [Bowmanella sp. JS7-9]TBX25732.1 hypothetical protein TK45_03320 [Bowmanella sp. JS7-9]